MTCVRPFQGSLVSPDKAHEVVAPAYDSMTAQQRARFAEARPLNFLNVMQTQDDYADATDINEILARNKQNLNRLFDQQCFVPQSGDALYIYRLIFDGHQQTGLVGEIPVEEIEQGKVLRHELTRQDREDLLVQYQSYVGVSSSPVALAYKANAEIKRIQQEITRTVEPYLDHTGAQGLRQMVWKVDSAVHQQQLQQYFAAVDITYITDGHHRAAAATRFLEHCRLEGRDPGEWCQLLVALFPDDELSILSFNRCVKDLNGLDESEFFKAVAENFHVEHLQCDPTNPPGPEALGNFVMVLDDSCYHLRVLDTARDPDNPVASLDVNRLHNLLLNPILGIEDPRNDPRLEYVSGLQGGNGVQALRQKNWRLAFYCHPISMQELMAVADAGQVMPPKSTSFEPKVGAGVFLQHS